MEAGMRESTAVLHHFPNQLAELGITSAPIEAWKCNFPTFKEVMTDQPTNRPSKKDKHKANSFEEEERS